MRRGHCGDLVADPLSGGPKRWIREQPLHGIANSDSVDLVRLKCETGTGAGARSSVEELVGTLGDAELGNLSGERGEERARPAVRYDRRAVREESTLGDVPGDVDAVGLDSERIRIAVRTDRDRYPDIEFAHALDY